MSKCLLFWFYECKNCPTNFFWTTSLSPEKSTKNINEKTKQKVPCQFFVQQKYNNIGWNLKLYALCQIRAH